MPRKETSPELSSTAARYLEAGREGLARLWDRNREQTITDILAAMASLVSQDEHKGQGHNPKA